LNKAATSLEILNAGKFRAITFRIQNTQRILNFALKLKIIILIFVVKSSIITIEKIVYRLDQYLCYREIEKENLRKVI
jgi:hypothetical protein